METTEVKINNNEFEYNGITYNVEYAIGKDKKAIIAEAEYGHKEEFEKLYVKESLTPKHVRLYLDDKKEPMYGIIIYSILYQDWYRKNAFGPGRSACGNHHPIERIGEKYHFGELGYQGSICW